jgi:hypothetical protein
MKTLNSKKLLENRLKAAQKYFTYYKDDVREFCQLPCPIIFDNKPFMSFCNVFSVSLTKDRIEMETFKNVDLYPDITRVITLSKETETINLLSAFKAAKEIGYRLKKSEVNGQDMHFFKYKNMYYSIGLTDINFRIINDGKPCEMWNTKGKYPALIIKTSVGYAYVLPVVIKGNIDGFRNKKNIVDLKEMIL